MSTDASSESAASGRAAGRGSLSDDLTGFQRDILFATARLGGEPDAGQINSPKGAAIRDVLESTYGAEVTGGRAYPVFDQLVADGLLEKGTLDRRSNYYHLTEAGFGVCKSQIRYERESLDGSTALSKLERVERFLCTVADSETKATVTTSEVADALDIGPNAAKNPVKRVVDGESSRIELVDTEFSTRSRGRWEVKRR